MAIGKPKEKSIMAAINKSMYMYPNDTPICALDCVDAFNSKLPSTRICFLCEHIKVTAVLLINHWSFFFEVKVYYTFILRELNALRVDRIQVFNLHYFFLILSSY